MHYYCLVALPPGGEDDVERTVARLLDPFEERYDDSADELTGWWDWWVIGGRWTGGLDGYDPTEDPRNYERCNICSGTGIRPGGLEQFGRAWYKACNGCNGCRGRGTSLKFRFAPHDGDVAAMGDALREHLLANSPYTVVFGEVVVHRETFVDAADEGERTHFEEHPDRILDALRAIPDGTTVVVVDYHC